MDRRKFMKSAAAVAAASTVFSPHTFAQGGNVRWRMATSWPKSLDLLHGGAEYVARRVSALTDGRFQIRVFEAGELVPGLQVLDAVQSGTVECGHSAGYYYLGKNPALGFATAVPFGLTTAQHNTWIYAGGGGGLLRRLYADFSVVNFLAGNTGAQAGGWFKREVTTAAQLRGLRIRIPGFGGQVMSRLGSSTQVLPGGEIYLALDRGAVDAAEWVGPYDDEKLGLNRAARFYYFPGWQESTAALELYVNQAQFARLPRAYQEALAAACAEANLWVHAQYEVKNPQALARMRQGGTQLRAFSQDILRAAFQATMALHNENASSSAAYRQVYTAWRGFRAGVRGWNNINEKPLNDLNT